jgi:hypothetical protein
MATVIYQCPTTGQKVQTWFSDDGSEDDDDTYETVTCMACQRVHLVSPRTGKTVGGEE